MYSVIIKNFKSKKQAQTFIEWYEGQGEQDAEIWFDIHEQETPTVNVHKKYEYDKINKIITVFVK